MYPALSFRTLLQTHENFSTYMPIHASCMNSCTQAHTYILSLTPSLPPSLSSCLLLSLLPSVFLSHTQTHSNTRSSALQKLVRSSDGALSQGLSKSNLEERPQIEEKPMSRVHSQDVCSDSNTPRKALSPNANTKETELQWWALLTAQVTFSTLDRANWI